LASLPPDFLAAIRAQLGPDADRFLATYADPPTHGLRVNPAKIDLPTLRHLTGWTLEPIPWCPTGAYVDAGSRPGAHPFHAAGLYYLQEPTAMAVAEMALLEPGQTVLDLAASPGGRSTQIASAIGVTGLLVANEIHPARIKALGENLERWGATNTIITNRAPDDLATIGPMFDRVIIDAPCSGEGLFRRDPAARAQWSPERVRGSSSRQRIILESAISLLKPGGVLVYSTCTFNRAENEDVITDLVASNPDLTIDEITRLWPHEVRGEGHTIHRLRLAGETVADTNLWDQPQSRPSPAWDRFVAESLLADPIATWGGLVAERSGRTALVPSSALAAHIQPAVRTGLWLGDSKPGRFEPAHALALAIDPNLVRNRLDLSVADAHQWIAGKPVRSAGPAGWVLITVAGYGLGWGKRSGQTVKNHYPKGLRRPTPKK